MEDLSKCMGWALSWLGLLSTSQSEEVCGMPGGFTLHRHCVRMMVPNGSTFHKMSSEFSPTKLSKIVKIRDVFTA